MKIVHRALHLVTSAYKLLITVGNSLQPVVLLMFRSYWGWQFFESGKGKLLNHGNVVSFFTELGIPAPGLNAWFVSGLECGGGLLLLVGLFSRPIAFMMICNMAVAYATADHDALVNIFSDPDPFFAATPFLFLVMSVLVFVFGPGAISVDYVIKRFILKNKI